MTFTVSPWAAWAGTCLALFGACFVAAVAWRAARDVAGRIRYWLRDRVTPFLGPDEATEQEQSGLCAGCWDDSEHCDDAYDTCDCTCTWPEDWAEQEQEEKVASPPHHDWDPYCRARGCQVHGNWEPPWEAEHRAAYESLGFEYPSGMMERVRELTP